LDVRIGIMQTPKEIELELPEDIDRESLMKDIDSALCKAEGVLWLNDRRGRRVGVPVAHVAYVELGPPVGERRVGFGAP